MNILYAILLGLVQGIAEFLPISSSGHLALFETILGGEAIASLDESAAFNILLHLATLVAVVIAYWQDVRGMAVECGSILRGLKNRESLSSGNVPARRLILMIVVATLPLVVIVPLHHTIEKLSGVPWFIGVALLVTGLLLFIADRMPQGNKSERDMTIGDAVMIGFAQAVATLPGLSRSGATITAGMSRGLTREFAVKFSFLMSLLSVLGAVVLKVIDLIGTGLDASLLPVYLVGMVVAGVTGYLSIQLLKKLVVKKGRFGGFAYYCWGVGALSIVLSLVLKG